MPDYHIVVYSAAMPLRARPSVYEMDMATGTGPPFGGSQLRGILALLSAGGLFYVAQCHERGARAAVVHAPIHVCEFKEAAVARPEILSMLG